MRGAGVVGLALALGCGAAAAKTLAESTGPAELPPKGYAGNQYVDSEGCVFLRAGYAGEVVWVPRVDRNRNLICGMKPTFPRAEAAAAPALRVVGVELIPFEDSGCTFAPETVQRFTLSDGRAFVNCGAPVDDPAAYLNGLGRADLKVTGPAPAAAAAPAAAPAAVAPPPAPPPPAEGAKPAPAAAGAPAPDAAAGDGGAGDGEAGVFIQVGVFAVAGNAEKAVRMLERAGVPARARPGTLKGRALDFVVAGPFASRAEAARALEVVRARGFPDAFLR